MISVLSLALSVGCGSQATPAQSVATPAKASAAVSECEGAATGTNDASPEALDRAQKELTPYAPRFFRDCGRLAPPKTPPGIVVAKVVVDADGRPTASVHCSTLPESLTACVVAVIAEAKFSPPPAVPRQFLVPIRFKAP